MKRIQIFLAVLLCGISFITLSNVNPSQKIVPEKVLYSEYSTIPSLVVFPKGKELLIADVAGFLEDYFEEKVLFSLKLIDCQSDELGFLHYRYQQLMDGIPVNYAYYVVHTKANKVVSMHGQLFDNLLFNDVIIDANTAIKKATEHISAKEYMWENLQEEKLLKQQSGNDKATYFPDAEIVYFIDPSNLFNPAKKAFKIVVYASNPLSKQNVFIDAAIGKVLFSENLLQHKDVKGVANTVYSGLQTITTDSTNTGYTLKEVGRGNGIETYNMKNSTNFSFFTDFTDKNNVWDTINVQKDQYAVDAHWGAEKTYDYYLQKHNRNSIDNNGFKLINMVHYGSAFGNAYWDGARMVFGDGDGVNTKNPLVSLDIIGHEITHGITSNTAKLVSQNEPGALNESFSDIFGVTIDWYARPDKANWKVGDEISSIFRSLEDPNATKHPDTYQGNYWTAINDVDFGGIHSNNGVQNFWYYLLVVGGNGINDKGNVYNVAGIGIDKAAAIAYRNLTVYLTSLSNFQDARFYAIQAAIDLFGSCSPEVESVANAWYAVGVGAPYLPKVTSDFVASYGKSCRELKVNFTNKSSNAQNYFWDFGDGNTTEISNPSHVYTKPGKYTVQLIAKASNACGISDSMRMKDLVEIHPINPKPIQVAICPEDSIVSLISVMNGPLAWYSSDSSQVVLDTASLFSIKNPNSDTSFYLGSTSVAKDSTMHVGETNVSTNIGNYVPTVRYQIFDVFKPLVLKSVLVNAYAAGERVIELRDASGKVLQARNINIPVGIQRIELNFDLDPGVDYQLGLSGTLGALGRSNAGVKYPYELKDVISIKGSNAINAGLQFYYSFYDWEIVSVGCNDTRQEYQIKINYNSCLTNGLINENLEKVTVYPNPSQRYVTLTNLPDGTLKVMDLLGKVIVQKTSVKGDFELDMIAWENGMYVLELNTEYGTEVIRIIKE